MSYDNMSFNRAFASARKAGAKTFKWRGRIYTTKTRDEVNVPTTVGRTGKPALYIDQNGLVQTTNMNEIVVNAPRTKIDPKYKGTLFGLLRYKPDIENYPDRVWQDYTTGQYFITDNYGNIVGQALSQEDADKLNFSHYYGKQNREAERQAALSEATDEINKSVSRWDPRNLITQEKLDNDIRNARNQFANTVNGLLNYGNHVVLGPVAAAVRDDYSLSDWYNNLNPYSGIQNQIIGLGDVFNPQSETLRWGLNLINPTSVALSAASSTVDPGRLVATGQTKPSYLRLTATEAPKSSFRIQQRGTAVGSPVRLSNQGRGAGYRQYSHPSVVFGNTSAASSRPLTIKVPGEQIYGFTNPYVDIKLTPTLYYRSPITPTEERTLPVPFLAYIESLPISAHQKQWALTGEVPEYPGNEYKVPTVLSTRPSAYMHENLVWKGLEGDGGKLKPASYGNTNYEPRGYNIKFQ